MNDRERELAWLSLDGERDVLDDMRGHYEEVLSRVNDKIDALADRDDLSGIRQRRWQESLAQQIGGALAELRSGSYSTVRQYLENSYEQGFVGTLYNLQGQDIPLAFPIDQAAAARAVSTTAGDVKLSARVYSNVDKLQKQVIAEVTRGFADSETAAQVAGRIATQTDIAEGIKRNVGGRTDQALRRSMTIARTERGRVSAEAKLAAMAKAKANGADIVKQWDSTMDKRTRLDHVRADGQIREVGEKFSVGGCKGMAPHKMGRADQDVNCRCVLLQRARSPLEVPEEAKYTKWDGDKQCYVDLSDAKSFSEFKGRYYKTILKTNPKASVSAFVPATSIDEAQKYAKQFIVDSGYSPTFKKEAGYKGLSLDMANQVNEALHGIYSAYDIPKLSGLKTVSATSAKGKKVFRDADAVAAYNAAEQGIYLNSNILKSTGTFEKHVKESSDAFEYVKANLSRLTGSRLELGKRYVNAGRSLVDGETVRGAIEHELGHHVDWAVFGARANDIRATGKKYSSAISGYAGSSAREYMAESFVAYVRGETSRLNPEFVKLMESKLPRKGSVPYIGANKVLAISDELHFSDNVVIGNKQFGKKAGKHCSDFGLDPAKEEDREKFLKLNETIIANRDKKIKGTWHDAAEYNAIFYIKDEDVIIVRESDNSWVTVLKGGVKNERVNSAIKKARDNIE